MSTLTGQKIKDTYDGLLKTTQSTAGLPSIGRTVIEDGLGNDSALSLGRAEKGAAITGGVVATGSDVEFNEVLGADISNGSALKGTATVKGATITEAAQISGGLILDYIDGDFVVKQGSVSLIQGTGNSFVGTDAGNHPNGIGGDNTAVGVNSQKVSISTSRCTSVGAYSLENDTRGNKNVAIGNQALQSNTKGSFNTAVGSEAMLSNLVGQQNTAIGEGALRLSRTSDNIAVGKSAMGISQAGAKNIAIGFESLNQAASASSNIIVGYQAAKFKSTGNSNIVLGRSALLNDQSSFNIAIGQNTLSKSNSNSNVAIGSFALQGQSAQAVLNTAIGHQAGYSNQTGRRNVIIGENAIASSPSANNEVVLGNAGITVLRCAVQTITSLSDERDKTDVKDLEYGLDFINSLQPREFVWNQRVEMVPFVDEDGKESIVEEENENRGKKDFGFIAQEVRELDNDTLRLVHTENEERLEMSYGKLVPILVKAIQELQAEVNALKK